MYNFTYTYIQIKVALLKNNNITVNSLRNTYMYKIGNRWRIYSIVRSLTFGTPEQVLLGDEHRNDISFAIAFKCTVSRRSGLFSQSISTGTVSCVSSGPQPDPFFLSYRSPYTLISISSLYNNVHQSPAQVIETRRQTKLGKIFYTYSSYVKQLNSIIKLIIL